LDLENWHWNGKSVPPVGDGYSDDERAFQDLLYLQIPEPAVFALQMARRQKEVERIQFSNNCGSNLVHPM
jgi:hypothetical protein